jgi:hypothetical protein
MRCFVFLFIGYSITNAVVFLHVFHWFRRLVSGVSDYEFKTLAQNKKLSGVRQTALGRLVRCHACAGFWIGVSLSFLVGGFIPEYMETVNEIVALSLDGFLLSGFNLFAWLIFRKLGVEEL